MVTPLDKAIGELSEFVSVWRSRRDTDDEIHGLMANDKHLSVSCSGLEQLIRAAERAHHFEKALDPNLTKHNYIGEFGFTIECVDELGETHAREVVVPWPTIKEIMKAIHKLALSLAPEGTSNG